MLKCYTIVISELFEGKRSETQFLLKIKIDIKKIIDKIIDYLSSQIKSTITHDKKSAMFYPLLSLAYSTKLF